MKVSLVQLATVIGELKANLAAAERAIRDAAAEDPDTLVLPEAWNLGFLPDDLSEAEAAGDGPARHLLRRLAAELGVHIVGGSILCRDGGDVRNRCFVFDRSGDEIAACDKQHPFAPMEEDRRVRAGEGAEPFELDGVRCGVLICYDLRFPEVARRLAFAGATVLFVPAQWPDVRLAAWRTLLRARAIENSAFVIGCNGCGGSTEGRFGGHSMVIDPAGGVICELPEEPCAVTAGVDLGRIRAARSKVPAFDEARRRYGP